MNGQGNESFRGLVGRLFLRLGLSLAVVGAAFVGYLWLIYPLERAAHLDMVREVVTALAGFGVAVMAFTWIWLGPVRQEVDELAAGRQPSERLAAAAGWRASWLPAVGAAMTGTFWIMGALSVRSGLSNAGIASEAATGGVIAGLCAGLISALVYYYLSLGDLFPVRLAAPSKQAFARGAPIRLKVLVTCCAVLLVGVSMVGVSAFLNHHLALESARVDSCSRTLEGIALLDEPAPALVQAASKACGAPAAAVVGDRVIVPWALGDPTTMRLGRGPDGTLLSAKITGGASLFVLVGHDEREEAGAFAGQMAIFAAIALLLAIGVALVASRAITFPLRGLAEGAQAIAHGDLTREIVVLTGDEIGSLGSSLGSMSDGLRTMVGNVTSAAASLSEHVALVAGAGMRVRHGMEARRDGVVGASGEMSSMDRSVAGLGRDVSGLSEYVASTGAAVAEFSAALDEVRRHGAELERAVQEARGELRALLEAAESTRGEIAALGEAAGSTLQTVGESGRTLAALDEAAREADRASAELAQETEAGGRVVEESVRGVEAVRVVVAEAKQRVETLGKRSEDVTAVVDFIAEVAGRTNLLSLNAAIIAAQAGEQGKAFGVVADQIRELASQIGSSTKRIADIISGVNAEVDATRALIDQSDALAAVGVERAREGGQALRRIAEATQLARSVATTISPAVSAHAATTRQIEQLAGRVVEMAKGFAGTELLARGGRSIEALAQSLTPLTQKVGRALEEQTAVSKKQVESLEEINRMISRINRTISQHGEGTARALKSLSELVALADEDRLAADELADAAHALTEHAAELREGLGQFRV
jgi:methyl-accepting chemotaxis protein